MSCEPWCESTGTKSNSPGHKCRGVGWHRILVQSHHHLVSQSSAKCIVHLIFLHFKVRLLVLTLSQTFSTLAPSIPLLSLRLTNTRWFSVPPDTSLNPFPISDSAIALAFLRTLKTSGVNKNERWLLNQRYLLLVFFEPGLFCLLKRHSYSTDGMIVWATL